jgi:hypothetical protein
MAWLVGHREPKGADTAMSRLSPPRQSSTLPSTVNRSPELNGGSTIQTGPSRMDDRSTLISGRSVE